MNHSAPMFAQPRPNTPLTAQHPQVPHLQYAAICYRLRHGKIQILLITSRGGRRWTIPKGWPMRGRTPPQTAAREAWEEAGVEGLAGTTCLGGYTYTKIGKPQPHLAMVFPVEVTRLHKNFPERGERKRRWVGRRRAATLLSEPELCQLVLRFDPTALGR